LVINLYKKDLELPLT